MEGTLSLLDLPTKEYHEPSFQSCPWVHPLERQFPPWCWGHGCPEWTPTCFSGLIWAALYHSNSNGASAIKSPKILKGNFGSFIPFRGFCLHKSNMTALACTGSRQPQGFTTFDPKKSYAEGTQEYKAEFETTLKIYKIILPWQVIIWEDCWTKGIWGCILYFVESRIDASIYQL